MAELTKLGRYQIRRVLGRGAMGVVYEGFDPSLGRRVAVKTILKNAAIDEETARAYSAQFAREAQAAGRLNHPNIVHIHDFAEEQDVAYLVMEFIEGRELRSYFDAHEKFDAAETVRIMGELLDALEFAHGAGVVHRDVKPANIMMDAQRRVKLADFGVARIQDAERSAAGTMVGTPAFMSPEQISGGKIDRRTDVFSAGTILYQLLTGEQPFKGEGAWTVARKIMQDDPPHPSSVVKSVSPVYDAIVDKALAKNPQQRFASASEFAVALRATLAGKQPTEAPAAAPAAVEIPRQKPKALSNASEAEVEFWRSIQNSTDADEIEFYLEQFPEGTYSQLARHKIAKLREPQAAQDAQRREAEIASLKEKAEQAARKAAEAKAQKEADEQARREAEERAKHAAREKAKREAEEKAKRDAAENAKRESEVKIRQAQAQAQAQALARLRQQEEAAARARLVVDEDATVAIGSGRPAQALPVPPAQEKKSLAIPAVAAISVIAISVGAYLLLGRTPAPAPVAESPAAPKVQAPAKPEITAADIEKIKKETEERIRREYADKSAAEQAVAAKAATERAVQEKMLAAKASAEKVVAEKAAAEKVSLAKLAEEKARAEKAAAEKSAAEKAAIEKAAAEKAAEEKAVAEKAAADKAAADKAAAAKVAVAARPGWPSVGDRWIYEARDAQISDRKYQVVVEVRSVDSIQIRDAFRSTGGNAELAHHASALLASQAPGIVSFMPYLRAFQEVRGGESWNNIPMRVKGCVPNGGWTCNASARVVGKERVSVRAGSFETWKITVDIGMRGSTGGTYSGELTYWYSEDVKRLVKYQSRIRNSFFQAPNVDMELLSYTPATK